MNRLIGSNTDRYLRWGIGMLVAVLLSLGVIHSALPAPVWAATIVCDPQPGINYYVVLVNDIPQRVEAQADGSLRLEVTDTTAIYKAAACNQWECSHTVTVAPGAPNRMRMQ